MRSRRGGATRLLVLAAVLTALAWGLTSKTTVEAAPSPVLLGAFADDASGGGAGLQGGDRVALVFDSSTDAIAITALNIDTVLPLSGGHSWRDGSLAIGGAVWTVTTFLNDTLIVTLSTAGGVPTLALGDTVSVAPSTIQDVTGVNDATGTGITIGDSFDHDSLMVANTSFAPTFVTAGANDHLVAVFRATASSNAVTASSITLTRTGTAVDGDTAANGISVYYDVNTDSALDGGDTLLGSGSFSGGTVTIAISQVLSTATWRNLLVVVDMTAGATADATIGVQLASAAAMSVTAPDAVRDLHFPIASPVITIAGPSPTIVSAAANAAGGGGAGAQAGDQVIIVFDTATDGTPLAGAQVNAALPLSNSHTWLDGTAAVTSAIWSTTTLVNDTLTITLADTVSGPTVSVGDMVAPASLIHDVSGNNVAGGPSRSAARSVSTP